MSTAARSCNQFAPLGATALDENRAEFRVWAPRRRHVAIEIDGVFHALVEEQDGLYETTISAGPGARYRYYLDNEGPFADPCSRSQPDGVTGASELIDSAHLSQPVTSWQPPSLKELAIYELHVGTFTTEGTFSAVTKHLAELRELGIRAIELMPVATFPGQRGWGYDGLYTWAPHPVYGKPSDLAMLVHAAHDADLGVILDVVYNHLGPGSEMVTTFGPYLTDHHRTPWGDAIDYGQRAVREWAIQNAELWIRDYHFDGLRLDAVHAIFDDNEPHVLAELASRVHQLNPNALVISEMETGDLRPIELWGHDAQWGDELHHAVHVLLTGEHEGYYKNFGTVADLAKALERPQRERFIVCAQNHDQVGNRAFGDRLHGQKLRLAAFCALLSPGTPMLFMGEEYDEAHPFQFFTDHIDPAIAEATRIGRRCEFASFAAFKGATIPDPQDESTFLNSKLDPTHGDREMCRYYHELLQIRTKLVDTPISTFVDENRRFLRVRRGEFELTMNFSDTIIDGVPPWSGSVQS